VQPEKVEKQVRLTTLRPEMNIGQEDRPKMARSFEHYGLDPGHYSQSRV
jgi:hypothetical protein